MSRRMGLLSFITVTVSYSTPSSRGPSTLICRDTEEIKRQWMPCCRTQWLDGYCTFVDCHVSSMGISYPLHASFVSVNGSFRKITRKYTFSCKKSENMPCLQTDDHPFMTFGRFSCFRLLENWWSSDREVILQSNISYSLRLHMSASYLSQYQVHLNISYNLTDLCILAAACFQKCNSLYLSSFLL